MKHEFWMKANTRQNDYAFIKIHENVTFFVFVQWNSFLINSFKFSINHRNKIYNQTEANKFN